MTTHQVKARLAALFLLVPWSLILVIACGGGGGKDEPPPAPTDCPQGFIEAPSRGLACLHCNHPNARSQVNVLVGTMIDACIRNVSWNVLVSGTFGYDEAFMIEQIDKLSSERHLTLTLYYLNGPGMRRYKTKLFDGFAEKMSPDDFRKQIQWNETLRDSYRNHASQFNHLIDYALSVGASVQVIPMLEDNLTDNAFTALKLLTEQVLAGRPVRIGRNPCVSCWPGNQGWVPPGVFEEKHVGSPHFSTRNGIVTNDGDDLSDDHPTLRSIRNRAGEQGNEFILWTARFQGIKKDGVLVDPDTRNYITPEQSEILELESILKGE